MTESELRALLMKLPMRKIRDVLRLKFESGLERAIADPDVSWIDRHCMDAYRPPLTRAITALTHRGSLRLGQQA